MKIHIGISILAILVAIAAMGGCGSERGNAETGDVASYPVLPGDEFDPAHFRGSVLVVDFFGTT